MFRKTLLFVVLLAMFAPAAVRWMPQNVRLEIDTQYVTADSTGYTRKFAFAGDAWRVGKIAFRDTSLVDQDTIDLGDGIKVWQEICFPTGNLFGFDSSLMDTICETCGDTMEVFFDNGEGLSRDSIICNTTDTARMKHTSLGGDSMWITDGYFVLQSDPPPLTRFKYTGASDIGATLVEVIFMIWTFDHVPTGRKQ